MLITRRSVILASMFDYGELCEKIYFMFPHIYRTGREEKELLPLVVFMIYDFMSYVFV
jgi:hypothetical protein